MARLRIPGAPGSCRGPAKACQFSRSSMARIAVGKALDVVFLHELSSELFLVRRRFISHVEDLIARPEKLLRIAMTLDTPVHVERVRLVRERHQVDSSVARSTADALVDVNAVIEIDEIRKVVNARPRQRLTGAETGAHRLENHRIGPDLRMAGHTDLGGWYARHRRCFHRRMAIPAIEAV